MARPKRRVSCFFFNDTATTEIYTSPYTLSLHDALPICSTRQWTPSAPPDPQPQTLSRSEEHTSELQSHGLISYAVFCLKKKITHTNYRQIAFHALTSTFIKNIHPN